MKKQQTIANLVNTLGNIDLQDDEDTDDEVMQTSVNMVRSRKLDPPSEYAQEQFYSPIQNGVNPPSDILEVRAHFEYGHTLKEGEIYAISDGGADSCILGKNAKVLSYTGRYATLIGYDPATTKTEKVPIVTALLKATSSTEGEYPVLLKVHEAPYNANSPITLLSEYQIREYGLIIDSVATKHHTGINTTGTQRFQISPHVHINFEDWGDLWDSGSSPLMMLTRPYMISSQSLVQKDGSPTDLLRTHPSLTSLTQMTKNTSKTYVTQPWQIICRHPMQLT
jgi:hypothetical protein